MRCIFISKEWHVVHTHWGAFRLDDGAYQDYLAGKLWITWVPGKRAKDNSNAQTDVLPPDVTDKALRLRDMAAKQGLYLTLQTTYPGAQVKAPYTEKMRDKSIDDLDLSLRSSNGLKRANAGTFGRLWNLMAHEKGLRSVRNLGIKSEAEIKRCFYDACYISLTPNEQAVYWQKIINENPDSP